MNSKSLAYKKGVQKSLGIAGKLWLRTDVPREQSRNHWIDQHAKLAGSTPTIIDYRQNHFDINSDGVWPDIAGLETKIPYERRMDGLSILTLKNPLYSLVRSHKHKKKVFKDEQNAFDRVLMSSPGPGRQYIDEEQGKIGFRTVAMVRKRFTLHPWKFYKFINDQLGAAFSHALGIIEIRTQAYLPWCTWLWLSPNVKHDLPMGTAYHGSMVIGAKDFESFKMAFNSDAVQSTMEAQHQFCTAIHAYPVTNTYHCRGKGKLIYPPDIV